MTWPVSGGARRHLDAGARRHVDAGARRHVDAGARRHGNAGGRCPIASERGSGTVLAVASVGALLVCLLGGLAVAAAVQAAHTARTAADLSALAAAALVQQGVPAPAACARAGQVAASNDGALRSCVLDAGGRVTVEVGSEVVTPLPALALGSARARARAGTVP